MGMPLFEANVGGPVAIREKAPAGGREQLVDSDAGGGFVHRISQM